MGDGCRSIMKQQESDEGKCPKCSMKMRKSFGSISGNSKYVNFVCEQCGHKDTKCMGLMPEPERF